MLSDVDKLINSYLENDNIKKTDLNIKKIKEFIYNKKMLKKYKFLKNI